MLKQQTKLRFAIRLRRNERTGFAIFSFVCFCIVNCHSGRFDFNFKSHQDNTIALDSNFHVLSFKVSSLFLY